MKRSILILAATLLLGMTAGNVSAQAQQPEDEKKPGITFDFISYDFGEFRFRQDSKTVEIPYTNTGTSPLVVLRTEQSCTCLTVKYSKRPLQPGEKAVLAITYDPVKSTGKFSNIVTVHSNSDTPVQYIKVTGNVLKK